VRIISLGLSLAHVSLRRETCILSAAERTSITRVVVSVPRLCALALRLVCLYRGWWRSRLIAEQLSPRTSVRNQILVRRREAKLASACGTHPCNQSDNLSFWSHLKPMSRCL